MKEYTSLYKKTRLPKKYFDNLAENYFVSEAKASDWNRRAVSNLKSRL